MNSEAIVMAGWQSPSGHILFFHFYLFNCLSNAVIGDKSAYFSSELVPVAEYIFDLNSNLIVGRLFASRRAPGCWNQIERVRTEKHFSMRFLENGANLAPNFNQTLPRSTANGDCSQEE